MWDRVIQGIVAVAIPAAGLALRLSRRSRQLSRIRTYIHLADDLQSSDPDSAKLVRDLQRRGVARFVEAEHASLSRRLDPAAVFAWLFLVLPAVGLVAWAFTRDEWWKWPLIVFGIVWTLVWGGVGSTQLWKKPEEDEPPPAAS